MEMKVLLKEEHLKAKESAKKEAEKKDDRMKEVRPQSQPDVRPKIRMAKPKKEASKKDMKVKPKKDAIKKDVTVWPEVINYDPWNPWGHNRYGSMIGSNIAMYQSTQTYERYDRPRIKMTDPLKEVQREARKKIWMNGSLNRPIRSADMLEDASLSRSDALKRSEDLLQGNKRQSETDPLKEVQREAKQKIWMNGSLDRHIQSADMLKDANLSRSDALKRSEDLLQENKRQSETERVAKKVFATIPPDVLKVSYHPDL